MIKYEYKSRFKYKDSGEKCLFCSLHGKEAEDKQKKVENGKEQVQKVVWELVEEEKKYGKKRNMRSKRLRENRRKIKKQNEEEE